MKNHIGLNDTAPISLKYDMVCSQIRFTYLYLRACEYKPF